MDPAFAPGHAHIAWPPSEELRIQIPNSLTLAVIPAKAGIHLIVVLFGRFVKERMPLLRLYSPAWIPAFAGMTLEVLIVVLFGRFVKERMPLSRLMRRHGYPL